MLDSIARSRDALLDLAGLLNLLGTWSKADEEQA